MDRRIDRWSAIMTRWIWKRKTWVGVHLFERLSFSFTRLPHYSQIIYSSFLAQKQRWTRAETHGFGPAFGVHTHPSCVCVCVPFCRWFVLLKFWLHGLCSKTALTAQTLRFKRIFRWNNNSYISRNTGMVTDNDVMFFYIGSRCFVFN